MCTKWGVSAALPYFWTWKESLLMVCHLATYMSKQNPTREKERIKVCGTRAACRSLRVSASTSEYEDAESTRTLSQLTKFMKLAKADWVCSSWRTFSHSILVSTHAAIFSLNISFKVLVMSATSLSSTAQMMLKRSVHYFGSPPCVYSPRPILKFASSSTWPGTAIYVPF